jgi:hypothetical protein
MVIGLAVGQATGNHGHGAVFFIANVFFSWIVDIPIAKDIFRTKLFIQG